MGDRLAGAATKTGAIAAFYLAGWVYRCQARGDTLSSRRMIYGAALLILAFAAALAWQAASKVRGWSWSMTFLGFTLTLVVVCVVLVAVVRSIA
jgi:hypothetical protein